MILKLINIIRLSIKKITSLFFHNTRFKLHKLILYTKSVIMWEFLFEKHKYDDDHITYPSPYLNYWGIQTPEWDFDEEYPAALGVDNDCYTYWARDYEGRDSIWRIYYSPTTLNNINLYRFMFLFKQIKHEYWPFFCRKFYLYTTGQDAWYKYMYRYNLYRNKTLPPFSTTYSWIQEPDELHYLAKWQMFSIWQQLKPEKKKIFSIRNFISFVWKNKKSRSIFRRVTMVIIIFLVNSISEPNRILGRFFLNSFSFFQKKKKAFLIFKKGWTYLAGLFIFIITSVTLLNSNETNISAYIAIATVFSMPVILLWQTFVFFFKTYQISKYTSANQRFWKRAIFVFWFIEFLMFLILLYLWCNAPARMIWSTSHSFFLQRVKILYSYTSELLLIPIFLITLCNALIFLNKTHRTSIRNLVHIIFFFAISYLLLFEFLQLIGVYVKTIAREPSYKIDFKKKKIFEVLNLVKIREEDTNLNQMRSLTTFLKFWHVLFVFVYYLFICVRLVEYKNLSFDTYSSLYVNLTALLFFNFIFLIFKNRKMFYFFLKLPPRIFIMIRPANIQTFVVEQIEYILSYQPWL